MYMCMYIVHVDIVHNINNYIHVHVHVHHCMCMYKEKMLPHTCTLFYSTTQLCSHDEYQGFLIKTVNLHIIYIFHQ